MSELSLLQKQQLFVRLRGALEVKAFELGYELTLGDAYRDPRVFGQFGERKGYGEAKSVHKWRLAQDYNLFKNGVWLTRTEDFATLGAYWKTLHPLCRWGGDIRSGDGNHFSFEHQGTY